MIHGAAVWRPVVILTGLFIAGSESIRERLGMLRIEEKWQLYP